MIVRNALLLVLLCVDFKYEPFFFCTTFLISFSIKPSRAFTYDVFPRFYLLKGKVLQYIIVQCDYSTLNRKGFIDEKDD